ncbi:MAG TPA: anthranilate phosphoribosyltransferase [Kofleriaceae bacterium]|nr:anthranilate phosphoribosyltransferase [Kofleriaceae bacterium]
MIVAAIARALDRRDLARDEMAEVFGELMDGHATPAQIGGLLVALRAKGEAIDELVGAATAMRARATPLVCPQPERGIDTCGTGGDGACTINVSTIAAVLLAANGAVVAKHGNRALSSRCGSADVLEALGVAIDAEPAIVERCMATAGIGFAFAPKFHAATRHAAGVRKELGTRTIFNLLGPLTNPAHVRHQVVGVYDRRWCEPVAAALGALGLRRAAVVHGHRGLDELEVAGATHVALWDGECVQSLTLSPRSFGLADVDPAGLAGRDIAHNARVMTGVLAGEVTGAPLHAAGMTAALGLALLDGALDDLPACYARAIAPTRDGSATRVLEHWATTSRASR